jgi:hypothetical protein
VRATSSHAGFLNIKDAFYSGSVQHLSGAVDPTSDDHENMQLRVHTADGVLERQTSNSECARACGQLACNPMISVSHKSVQHELTVTPGEHYIDIEHEPSYEDEVDGRLAAFKRIVMAMADLSLLKNVPFLLFLISNFLTSAGLNPPLIFLPDRALKLGIDVNTSSYLLSVFGRTSNARLSPTLAQACRTRSDVSSSAS